jgi:hypothetical protein
MVQFGTCDGGCTEQKLELVLAVHYDRLTALASSFRARGEAFRAVVEELASRQPRADELEAAYRSVQDTARITLRRYPEVSPQDLDWGDPIEPSTTWWCPECGGIDAPQPCLGICIWRPTEWVNATLYEQEWARALAKRDTERYLRELLCRVVSVTPRDGQWELGWRVQETQAQKTLRLQ